MTRNRKIYYEVDATFASIFQHSEPRTRCKAVARFLASPPPAILWEWRRGRGARHRGFSAEPGGFWLRVTRRAEMGKPPAGDGGE